MRKKRLNSTKQQLETNIIIRQKNLSGFQGPTGETSVNGSLTYDDKVIQKIIGIALEDVDGLLTVDGGFFSNIAEKLVNTDNVTSGINTEVGKNKSLLIWILW